jgi:hypothetical protein
MSKSKGFGTLLTIIFLMLIVASASIILPNMFASTDAIAEDNNITTSEYTTQYSTGQDFLQMFLIVLYIMLVLLSIAAIFTVVKMIM